MRALTVRQPWASIIALGFKRFETRSWRTHYVGPIAIHAGLSCDRAAQRAIYGNRFTPGELAETIGAFGRRALPRGAIVAVADLRGCYPTGDGLGTLTELERLVGDFTPGRWAWDLADVRVLKYPILCRGRQGLWVLPPGTV